MRPSYTMLLLPTTHVPYHHVPESIPRALQSSPPDLSSLSWTTLWLALGQLFAGGVEGAST